MPWYGYVITVIVGGAWSIFCLLIGAAVMKSSYSPPNNTKGL